MRPLGILETCLYATELVATTRFYRQFLGLEQVVVKPDRHCFFRCGDGMLLLFDAAATERGGLAPQHGAYGPGHIAFQIPATAAGWWRTRLLEEGVALEADEQWRADSLSLYFRDPAGNCVELTTQQNWLPAGLPPPIPGRLGGIVETCLFAHSPEDVQSFYAQGLGLERLEASPGRYEAFRSGHGQLLVFNPAVTTIWPWPQFGAHGPGHVAFRIGGDEFAAWRAQLVSASIVIEAEHSWAPDALSIYFRDPAGNSIELTTGATWGMAD